MAVTPRSAQQFFDELSPFADVAYGPNLDSPIDSDEDLTDPRDQVKQNFRTLLLTRPGEKLGDPEFGIGLQNFLFEMNSVETKSQISSRIKSQTSIYLSYIQITSIIIDSFEDSDNGLYVAVNYFVPQINQQDQIVVDFPENQ